METKPEPKIFIREIPIDRSKFVFPDSAQQQFDEAKQLMANGDHEKAKEKLRLAAADKHPGAIHELGCYLQLEKDYPQAMGFFQQAADMQFPPSIYNLGLWYLMGLGIAPDKAKGFSLVKNAAKLGHARAQYQLGDWYQDGDGVAVNKRKAFKWFQRSADQGDINGIFGLAMVYLRGMEGVVEKDDSKAREWLEKSATSDADSQYVLGIMYKDGVGGEKDAQKALQLFARASEHGHLKAQFQVGAMLIEMRNFEVGPRMLEFAAMSAHKANNAEMLFTIGEFYENHKQIKLAIPLYEAGAALHHPGCQYSLGLIYTLSEDNEPALKLITTAAENGYKPACICLGKIYTDGFCGVTPNKEEANKWLMKAGVTPEAI